MSSKKLKFLVDVNIEKPIIELLSEKGFDIKCVANVNKKLSDEGVIKLANQEERILITNDKDFGELLFYSKKISIGIILFRIKGQNQKEKFVFLDKLLMKHSDKISRHFVVISNKKLRFIPLEV
ncbi:MAG: DUF5615 family PIN-like protein [Thermodesulfobacteriota bacterium]